MFFRADKSRNLIYVSYINCQAKIDLVRYNLSKLIPFFDKVYLIYSSQDENSLKFPENFLNLPQTNIILVPNSGYDFGKYRIGLSKVLGAPMEFTTVMNDSVSICKDLEPTFNYISGLIKKNYEYIGYVESLEKKNHFQSWMLTFGQDSARYFYEKTEESISDKQSVIDNYEVDLSFDMMSKFHSKSLYLIPKNVFYYQQVIDLVTNQSIPFIKNNSFQRAFRKPPFRLKKRDLLLCCPEDLRVILERYQKFA